jgi:hypothetical protein
MDALSLLDDEIALVLDARPGDVVRHHGDTIGRLCGQGRPPFVVALMDDGPEAGRRAQADLAGRGLPASRLLVFGIVGEFSLDAPMVEAAVRALAFVCWRYDCNIICTSASVFSVASAAASPNGLGLMLNEAGQFRLIAAPRRSARETD